MSKRAALSHVRKLRAEGLVLTFQPPLEYNSDLTDKDVSKVVNNPGVFADRDEGAMWRVCGSPDLRKDFTAEECKGFPPPASGRVLRCIGRKQERSELDTDTPLSTFGANSPSSGPATRPFDGTVVISAITGHSAKLLCDSDNAWGLSFASLDESLFCDMEN